MKRINLIEFEDFSWFPVWLRNCMTNNIVVMARWLGVTETLHHLILKVLSSHKIDKIVDLGSGSGGVLPDVIQQIRSLDDYEMVSLQLTDKYPNQQKAHDFNADHSNGIDYLTSSVDATDFTRIPAGLKTMVNCFHHMSPHQARTILESAKDNREPLLIYEMGGHHVMPFALWLLSLPVALPMIFCLALVIVPFVRPMTWQHWFFSYLIPLIPFFYAWDGHASIARIYDLNDLDQVLLGLECSSYTWEKGFAISSRGNKLGTYLLGLPES